jgi:serine palmitoyltransferase
MAKRINEQSQLGYRSILGIFISFFILVVIGHIRDQMGKIFVPWKYRVFYEGSHGEPALFTTFDSFFIRRLYRRISDCWNRPIHGDPGRIIQVLERKSNDYNETFELTGESVKLLNVGSYNYLGFANHDFPTTKHLLEDVNKYNVNNSYPTADYKQHPIVESLEKEMAEFLYREDCIVYSMGYGTNTCTIPIIMNDSLIFSDEKNHKSLISAMRLSGSKVVVYEHNDMSDLENKLRTYISQGHPETHRSWKKIFVVVEGIYSMEGTIVNLRKLVELKKKYKFYIFMDEAHSIGCMGKTGRGICEYSGVNFSEVDILMGTFTKSFAGFGGYVAGDKSLINFLRANNDFAKYGEQMSPIVCSQILYALQAIQKDPKKLNALRKNTRIMRNTMKNLNFHVMGDEDSPVIPILIPSPGKTRQNNRFLELRSHFLQ